MQTVLSLMLKEHEKLTKMLVSAEKDIKKGFKKKENFNKFKQAVKAHFLVEEKAIYKAFITINELYDINRLKKEHKKILELIKKIEKSKGAKKDLANLKNFLTKHAVYETKVFYPKLENILDDKVKKEIFKKASKMIKG